MISTEGLSCWGRYNIQEQPDTDNDGYDASVDCDDNNSEIYPQAIEICDSIDNDCDGNIDENATTTYYLTDGDGYGNATR